MAKKKKELKQIGLFLLDKSGSMSTLQSQAISGFNEYIETLKKNKLPVDFTLTLFDTMSVESPYHHVNIASVEPLSTKTYVPMGGTPLYDSAVPAIEDLVTYAKQFPNAAISVVIMTDGYENASSKHDEKCLRDLVDKLTKQGNWTFAYMGANQDAWAQAAKYGISAGSTMSWNSTPQGTAAAFTKLASASVHHVNAMYAANARGIDTSMLNSNDFFKKEADK